MEVKKGKIKPRGSCISFAKIAPSIDIVCKKQKCYMIETNFLNLEL